MQMSENTNLETEFHKAQRIPYPTYHNSRTTNSFKNLHLYYPLQRKNIFRHKLHKKYEKN